MSTSQAGNWLPWAAPALTIVGWAIVSWQANRREIRKEQRTVADAAKKLVVDCASEAIACMCAEERDEGAEGKIKSLLDLLELELGRIPGYKVDLLLVGAMAAFADSCTGGDFESAARSQRSRRDPDVLQVGSSRNALLVKLEESFTRRYSSHS